MSIANSSSVEAATYERIHVCSFVRGRVESESPTEIDADSSLVLSRPA